MFNMIFDLLCKRIENLEQKVNDYEKRIADLEVQVQSQQKPRYESSIMSDGALVRRAVKPLQV